MNQSEQINDLAADLVKAQGELTNIKKDKENPFYHAKYSTLDAVWDSIRPTLLKHNLSVVQGPVRTEGSEVSVETMILHTTGQWISSTLALPIGDKHTAQAVGSAITYARRYGLSAMVGVASEEDTDAQDISGQEKKQAQKKAAPQKKAPVKEDLTEGKKAALDLADKMRHDGKIDGDIWALMSDEINKAASAPRLAAVYKKIEKRFVEAYPPAGEDEKDKDQGTLLEG